LCGVLAGLALSHMNDPDFVLLARKNYCDLFNCWTDELDAQGKVVGRIGGPEQGAAATAARAQSGGSETRLDNSRAEVTALARLAPAAAQVTKAASTLKSMLDPGTTSIVLNAQNDLDQELALDQLTRLKGSSHTSALQSESPAKPVSLLAKHLVNMEKTVLTQEQQMIRDEEGLPYETRASSDPAPRTRTRTLRDDASKVGIWCWKGVAQECKREVAGKE